MIEDDKDRIDAEIRRIGLSNDPFASAVRATRMPMIITDPHRADNPITFVNDAFTKLTGYSRAEILGRNCRFLQGPLTDKAEVAKLSRAIERREPIELEIENYKKNGETFWNRVLIAPVFDTEGELTHFFASQFDITLQRKHMHSLSETADRRGRTLDGLVERERRVLADIASGTPLRKVLENLLLAVEDQAGNTMRTSILIMDEEGRHLRHGAGPSLPTAYNDAIDGIPVGEGVGSCGTAIDRGSAVYVSDIANDPLWVNFRDLARDHDLGACWSTPIRGSDGSLLGTFAIYYSEPRRPGADDVAAIASVGQTAALAIERYRSEAALRASESRLRLAIDAGQIGEWELDLKTNTSVRARRHDQIFGYDAPVREWGIDTFLSHVVPEDRPATVRSFNQAAETGTWNFQCRIKRRNDGEIRWINTYSAPQRNDTGEIVKLFGVVQDVTDQKTAEIGLRAAKETLESQVAERTERLRLYGDIIQSSAAPICAFDTGLRLIAFNQAHSDEFFRIFGHRVQLGEVFPDLFPSDQAAIMRGLMNRALSGEIYTVTEEFGDPDLAKPCWEVSYAPLRNSDGQVIGAFHFAKDISERLRAEADLAEAQDALRQAQKMEAVGQLTGGVAHDFNNLLTVIKSSTDLLKRPDLAEPRRSRYVAAISETVDRAAKLTAQLLAFARRQALKPEVFAACDSVRALSSMIGTLAGSRIRIVTNLPEKPCFVDADASQFDTALVNMAVNARDAMNGEGTLTIDVRSVEIMPAIRSHPSQHGSFVAVSLADTGSGIPPERLDQIFEPFFTTKAVGQGTGLGLSQVFGFAKQSGGEVTVESKIGRGTTFTLYLPRVNGAVAGNEEGGQPEPLVDGHGTCVLVVEDNPDVGTFAVQMLTDLGYWTVLATNAEDALRELASDAKRFDVVFSDVVMPGMNGIELGQEIRRRHRDLPVLLASGYSHVLAQNGTYGFELLHKPYSVEELSRLLRKVAGWRRTQRTSGSALT